MTTTDPASPAAEPLPFPHPRQSRCPLYPPPALLQLQDEQRLARVQFSDGSTPWLVTRHADQKTLMSDPRISADTTQPGYPNPASRCRHELQ